MEEPAGLERVHRYHEGTKHHFNRFAQSLGYLDWASQPRPFRSFEGAPVFELYPGPAAAGPAPGLPPVTYDRLLDNPPGWPAAAVPVTAATLGHFLRHALGLSAWKAFQRTRWSLRVNPSSGNLHPTEAYIVTGSLPDFAQTPGVWHYAPDRHAIERRCVFDREVWRLAGAGEGTDAFFVALTSIHWRESWKYGERAFRYCQHDLGHAIGALGLSAALCGWRATLLPDWSHRAVAALTGVDRDEDYVEAEREEPACLMLVTRRGEEGSGVFSSSSTSRKDSRPLFVEAVRQSRWFGRASQLSEEHVQWAFIDEVARATEDSGRVTINAEHAEKQNSAISAISAFNPATDRGLDARTIILQRRSAVALDQTGTDRATFLRMLSRVLHGPAAPWDALWWSPRIHLALFVHRVEGVVPGLYLLVRAESTVPRLRAALRREFIWEPVADGFPLWRLQAGDYRAASRRLSCDQEIAADGFFSLGMIADFDAALEMRGPSFYRQLFWESGVVGQVLYLEAEAAGARATGIGCYYDDPVHQLLGLSGHAFQSLYHFTVGMPVEDGRLTTEPGYPWETKGGASS